MDATSADEERRPRQEAALETSTKKPGTTIPSPDDDRGLARRDLFALAGRREFAVRVISRRRDGIIVTQLYSHLAAAEKKVGRVRGYGLDVRLELVRLTSVMPLDDEPATR